MNGFAEIQIVNTLLAGLDCPWFVCGGWAIDLFLERVTRPHKDVDIAVARADQFKARDYLLRRGWKLDKAVNGELIPWTDDEPLVLPVHTIWCSNDEHDPNFIEILLNEFDDDGFRFRRDQSIRREREKMFFRTLSGLPVLAPEIVLLYKSNCLEEYAADFQNTVDALSEESRTWLKASLNKLYKHHLWAERL